MKQTSEIFPYSQGRLFHGALEDRKTHGGVFSKLRRALMFALSFRD
jgi:hypothetical protein